MSQRWTRAVARWGSLVVMLVTGMVACVPSWARLPQPSPREGLTPEALVRSLVTCPRGKVRITRIFATHPLPDGGMFVLYAGVCPPAQPQAEVQQLRGDALLLPEDGRMRRTGSMMTINHSPIPHNAFIEYPAGGFSTRSAIYAYVYGTVLAPQVAAVEALFDTGQVLRDAVHDGAYGMVLPGSRGPCQVRALGQDGQVLTLVSLALPEGEAAGPDVRPGGSDAWGQSQARAQTCATLKW